MFLYLIIYVNILSPENEYIGTLAFLSSVITAVLFVFHYRWRRKDGDLYGSIDKHILKIIIGFIKTSKSKEQKAFSYIQTIFRAYSSKQTKYFFNKYYNQQINVRKSCYELKTTSNEAKLFVLNALYDISNHDNILSKDEENNIEKIRRWMHVHINTLNAVKSLYLNKGLKIEKEILEDEARRKTAQEITKSFLPYSAYKILGVSPTVTKSQLKKVYRTLAKKYHPDKFHEQSDDIIEQMENKFQEITEAYEIIKQYKRY